MIIIIYNKQGNKQTYQLVIYQKWRTPICAVQDSSFYNKEKLAVKHHED